MGVTSYYSYGGEIIGEETGGVRRDYLTDALGSVTATVTGAAVVENTYRYKPYGETLAKTGSGSDPKFLWNGSIGSRSIANVYSEKYNRNRHYGTIQAIWTTIDSLWPLYPAYLYASANPVLYTDPDGLRPKVDPWSCSSKLAPGQFGILDGCLSLLCSKLNDPIIQKKITQCASKVPSQDNPDIIKCLSDFCKKGHDVTCGNNWKDPNTGGNHCKTVKNKCKCGEVMGPAALMDTGCDPKNGIGSSSYIVICDFSEFSSKCPEIYNNWGYDKYYSSTILHELGHACVTCHFKNPKQHKPALDQFGACVGKVLGCRSSGLWPGSEVIPQ